MPESDFYVKFGSNAETFLTQLRKDRAAINEVMEEIRADLANVQAPTVRRTGKDVSPRTTPGAAPADPNAVRRPTAPPASARQGAVSSVPAEMTDFAREITRAADTLERFTDGLQGLFSTLSAQLRGVTTDFQHHQNQSKAARERTDTGKNAERFSPGTRLASEQTVTNSRGQQRTYPAGHPVGGWFKNPALQVIVKDAPKPATPRAADVPRAVIDAAAFTRMEAGLDKTAQNTGLMVGKLDLIAARLQGLANLPKPPAGGQHPAGTTPAQTRRQRVQGEADEFELVSQLKSQMAKRERLTHLTNELNRAQANIAAGKGTKDAPGRQMPDEELLKQASRGSKVFRRKGAATGYEGDDWVKYLQNSISGLKAALADVPEMERLHEQLTQAIAATGTPDGRRSKEWYDANRKQRRELSKQRKKEAQARRGANRAKAQPETREERNARLDAKIADIQNQIEAADTMVAQLSQAADPDMAMISALAGSATALRDDLRKAQYKREGTRQEHKEARRAAAEAQRKADPRLVDATDATNRLGLLRLPGNEEELRKQRRAQLDQIANEYRLQGYNVLDKAGKPITSHHSKPQVQEALRQAYAQFQDTGEMTMEDLTKWQKRNGVPEYVPPHIRAMTDRVAQNVQQSFEGYEGGQIWGASGRTRPADMHLDSFGRERLLNDRRQIMMSADEEARRQQAANPNWNPHDPALMQSIQGNGIEADSARRALRALQAAAVRLDSLIQHAMKAEDALARWQANLSRVADLEGKVRDSTSEPEAAKYQRELDRARDQVTRDEHERARMEEARYDDNGVEIRRHMPVEHQIQSYYDAYSDLGSAHPDVVGSGLKAREQSRWERQQAMDEMTREVSDRQLLREKVMETYFGQQNAMGVTGGVTRAKGGKIGKVRRTESVSLLDDIMHPERLTERFGKPVDPALIGKAQDALRSHIKAVQRAAELRKDGRPEEEIKKADQAVKDHFTRMLNKIEEALGLEQFTLPSANKFGLNDKGESVLLERTMSMAALQGGVGRAAAAKREADKVAEKQRKAELMDPATAGRHMRDPRELVAEGLEAFQKRTRVHANEGLVGGVEESAAGLAQLKVAHDRIMRRARGRVTDEAMVTQRLMETGDYKLQPSLVGMLADFSGNASAQASLGRSAEAHKQAQILKKMSESDNITDERAGEIAQQSALQKASALRHLSTAYTTMMRDPEAAKRATAEGASAEMARAREILKRSGVQWSETLNESLHTASTVEQLFQRLKDLINHGTLLITPDIDVREGRDATGKDSYQLGTGPGGAAGTKVTEQMLREADIGKEAIAAGDSVAPIGTLRDVFDADEIAAKKVADEKAAKAEAAAKAKAAADAKTAQEARKMGATGIADDCCERIVTAINAVNSTLKGTLKISGTVKGATTTAKDATGEAAQAAANKGRGPAKGRVPTYLERATIDQRLAEKNAPDDLVGRLDAAANAEQRLAVAIELVNKKMFNQKEAKEIFAKDIHEEGGNVTDFADRLRIAMANERAKAKAAPMTGDEVESEVSMLAARNAARGQQTVTATLSQMSKEAQTAHQRLAQLARDYEALRAAGAPVSKLRAIREQMVGEKEAVYGDAFRARRTAFPDEKIDTTRRVARSVVESATGVKIKAAEGRELGRSTEEEIIRGIEERANGYGNSGNPLITQLFGGAGFMARALHTVGTFVVRNFAAGLVFGLQAALGDALAQAIETESTFVRVSEALEQTGRSSSGVRTSLQGISQQYGVALKDVYSTAAGLSGLFQDNSLLIGTTEVAVQLQMISRGALNAVEAMKALSGVTSAFGEVTPAQIADVATTIQDRLSVNIEETIEGVARMSGQAKELGLSFNQTATYVAAISKFTNQTGAGAGEQFSRILAALQTGRGQSAVISGLQSKDVDVSGAMQARDYSSVLQTLLQIYPTLTKAEQDRIAVGLGGQRQAAAINGLLREGIKINQTVAATYDNTGAAQRRATAIAATFANQLEIAQQAFVNLISNLGRTGIGAPVLIALKMLNVAMTTTNQVLSKFIDLTDSNVFTRFGRTVATGLLGAAAAIAVFRKAISGLWGALGSAVPKKLAGGGAAATTQELLGFGGPSGIAATRARGKAVMAEQILASLGAGKARRGANADLANYVPYFNRYDKMSDSRRGRFFARRAMAAAEMAEGLGSFGRTAMEAGGAKGRIVGGAARGAGGIMSGLAGAMSGLAGAGVLATSGLVLLGAGLAGLWTEFGRGRKAAKSLEESYNAVFGSESTRKKDTGVPPSKNRFDEFLEENKRSVGWGSWGGFWRNSVNNLQRGFLPGEHENWNEMHGRLDTSRQSEISGVVNGSLMDIAAQVGGVEDIKFALEQGLDEIDAEAQRINDSDDSNAQKARALSELTNARQKLRDEAAARIAIAQGQNRLNLMTEDQLTGIGQMLTSIANFSPMIMAQYSGLIAQSVKAMGFLEGSPILNTLTQMVPGLAADRVNAISAAQIAAEEAAKKPKYIPIIPPSVSVDSTATIALPGKPSKTITFDGKEYERAPEGMMPAPVPPPKKPSEMNKEERQAMADRFQRNLEANDIPSGLASTAVQRRRLVVEGLTQAANAAAARAMTYGDENTDEANKARETAFSMLNQLDQAMTQQLEGAINDATAFASLAAGRGDMQGMRSALSGAIGQLEKRRDELAADDQARAAYDQRIQDIRKQITDQQIAAMNAPLRVQAARTFNRSEQLRLNWQQAKNAADMYRSNDPVDVAARAKAEEQTTVGSAKAAAKVTTEAATSQGNTLKSAGQSFKADVLEAGRLFIGTVGGKDDGKEAPPGTPPNPNAPGKATYKGKVGYWMTEMDDDGRKRRTFVPDKVQPAGAAAMAHLDKNFASSLNRMMADAPGTIGITSGYRTKARQQQLWDEEVRKYGLEGAKKRGRVAPPGKSNHERGMAADLVYQDAATEKWVHDNAAKYGLSLPMGYEPWHIEPTSARKRKAGDNSTSGATVGDQAEKDAAEAEAFNAMVQDQIEKAQAAQQTALARMAPLDTLGIARQQLKFAQDNQKTAEMYGKDSTQYQQATQQVIAAQRSIKDAQDGIFNANANLSLAISDAAGNTLNSARIHVVQARNALKQAKARSGGKRTADVINAEAGVVAAEQAQKDAIRNDAIGTIDFNLQMGKITTAQAIASLQHILDTTRMSRDARREMELKIKGLKDSMQGGQWNLGDIKLPTVYEMRKSLLNEAGIPQMATGLVAKANAIRSDATSGSGAGFSSGDRLDAARAALLAAQQGSTVSIQINGGDLEAVKAVLAQYLGPVALGRTSISTTKV